MVSLVRRLLKAAALLSTIAVAHPAHATTVLWDESLSGDLAGTPPFVTLTLVAGANTVLGTSGHFSEPGSVSSDFDSFAIVVPTGMQVTDITFSSTLLPNDFAPSHVDDDFELRAGNTNDPFSEPLLGSESFDLFGSSSVAAFSAAMPIGSGSYQIRNAGFSALFPWTATYVWTLDVASTTTPVPEPSTLLLVFGTGCAWSAKRWRAARMIR